MNLAFANPLADCLKCWGLVAAVLVCLVTIAIVLIPVVGGLWAVFEKKERP